MTRFIISLLLLLLHHDASACTCELGTVEDKFNSAESVFLGKVKSVEKKGKKNIFGEDEILVTLHVTKSFKSLENTVVLDTSDNRSSCEGYWFKKDQSYLVYAYNIKNKLSTYYCGGVVPFDTDNNLQFQNELESLNRLKDSSHGKSINKAL